VKLSPSRRSDLRSEAHGLKPVVIIGDKGLTDEVVKEIDRSLKAHELIKVRAASDDRKARAEWFVQICERLEAQPVQEIGKIFVIYRENPEEKEAPRPKARPRSGDERMEGAREKQRVKDEKKRKEKEAEEVRVKRTERPRSQTPSPLPESEPRRRRPRTSR
jgi:putative YhbY family RNA-binding protein